MPATTEAYILDSALGLWATYTPEDYNPFMPDEDGPHWKVSLRFKNVEHAPVILFHLSGRKPENEADLLHIMSNQVNSVEWTGNAREWAQSTDQPYPSWQVNRAYQEALRLMREFRHALGGLYDDFLAWEA